MQISGARRRRWRASSTGAGLLGRRQRAAVGDEEVVAAAVRRGVELVEVIRLLDGAALEREGMKGRKK